MSALVEVPAEFRASLRARLLKHSKPQANGCIEWTGARDRGGYGRVNAWGRRQTGAHRAAWILEFGAIADPGLVLDHLCRNPSCLNVAHLELVSNHVNLLRGANTKRTDEKCGQGHLLSEDATPHITAGGNVALTCRRCSRELNKATVRNKRARARATPIKVSAALSPEQRADVLKRANPVETPHRGPLSKWELLHRS